MNEPAKWHPSQQSLEYHLYMRELFTPARPLTCRMCGWPGSLSTMCTVCLAMVKILTNRPSHYWLDLEAHEKIRERLRRMEEQGFDFSA